MADSIFRTDGSDFAVESIDINLNFASGGEDLAIRALTAGTKIKVVALFMTADAGAYVELKSDTTRIGGWNLAANGHVSLQFNPLGWCTTAAGEALNVSHPTAGANLRGIAVVQLVT